MGEEVPDVPGEEDKEGDDGAKSPEPSDGLSPRTRAKNRVADVIAKINNIVPPETYKPEPEEEIRPEAQMKDKQIKIGGYFARVITEEDEKRLKSRSRSRSRSRRYRRRDSRHRRRSRSHRRSRSRDRYKRRSRSRNRRHSRGREDRYRRSRSKEDKPSRTSRPAASPPKLNKKIEQKVEIVEIPVKVEQENVIDSTNDILETILMENKLRSQRSPSPDRLRLYKSPSPSPLKRKAKER